MRTRAEQQRIDDIADLLDAEETLYAQARAAADRGDTATAMPLLRKCAEAGTGEAAWLLAQLLEETGNTAEAMIWYQHARDDGDARADEKLAALRARPCPLCGLAGSPRGRPRRSPTRARRESSSRPHPSCAHGRTAHCCPAAAESPRTRPPTSRPLPGTAGLARAADRRPRPHPQREGYGQHPAAVLLQP